MVQHTRIGTTTSANIHYSLWISMHIYGLEETCPLPECLWVSHWESPLTKAFEIRSATSLRGGLRDRRLGLRLRGEFSCCGLTPWDPDEHQNSGKGMANRCTQMYYVYLCIYLSFNIFKKKIEKTILPHNPPACTGFGPSAMPRKTVPVVHGSPE